VAVSLSAALCGCAIAPIAGLTLAAQGATGVVAVSLGPLVDMQERSSKDQCLVLSEKGFSVSESLERAAAADEGDTRTFERAFWRPEFAREGYPQVERLRTPVEGTLMISDQSLSFVPSPGAASVHIPFELVRDVEIRSNALTGEPGAMIVRSCHGRFDIVTFARAGKPDSLATTEAAVELRARMDARRTAADN
jgi:hypothetical protein